MKTFFRTSVWICCLRQGPVWPLPHLILTAPSYFRFRGVIEPCMVCSQYEWLFFQTCLHSLSCKETQHPLAKTFLAVWETILLCFEADFYLLLLVVLNSASRRDCRELIPHLLSPEHLGDWRLLGYSHNFPPPQPCSVILCLKAVHTFSQPCCFWNCPSF